MPFPLHSLDYDCRRRLRQLVTPREAYDLQIAAPHFDGLKPIQKVLDQQQYTVKVAINDNDEVCVIEDLSKKYDFYLVKIILCVKNFTSNHSARLITDRFVLAPSVVTFWMCDLTEKFLRDISTKTETDIRELSLCYCTFHDDVTLELVCTLFKKLRHLDVFDNYFFKNTWIDTFISHNFINMTTITIHAASIDLLKVEEKQLIEFMQAQSGVLYISIILEDNCDDSEVRELLGNLFSNRFLENYVVKEKLFIFLGG
uniref:FTH domain-containing protein n=1 Tax=Panagrellus redivivus TaxID=6233 RepID=A0A7E4UYB9_PANRE